MLKQLAIYKLIGRVAEQQLRGCKAYAWRVMAEWLKTPSLVLSRHHLAIDWTLAGSLWVNQ